MVSWARPERDEDERAVVRRLSRARKAPRDVVMRARMIEPSRSGLRVPAIAVELGRVHHAFIPVGACRLNLQEGWWRTFRKAALAGRSFADPDGSGEAQSAQPGPRPRGRPHREVSRWVRQ
ncbi:hypothetical protein [Streptomyces sp. NPDC127066]|uniref:hypothetical protein n=1 Tax=Streptomyces sp. NPDC127066 TaxID=3347125 RepID=UPI00365853F1